MLIWHIFVFWKFFSE